jgi:import inner membrane translocase subunit TIM50
MATPKAEPAPESEPIASAVPPSEPPAPEKPSSAETAAAEAEAIPDKPDLSKLPSLDIDMDDVPPVAPAIEQPKDGAKGKGKKGGARKRPEYVSSQDERRRTMARLGYAALAVGGLAGFWYVSNKEGELGKKDDRPILEKLKGNITDLSDYFSKPAFTKLLPDALPPPYGRPYTLIVDLEDLLVHSSWDRQHGWRTAKRPGVDYFLSYMSQFYEVVLFTSQPSYVS